MKVQFLGCNKNLLFHLIILKIEITNFKFIFEKRSNATFCEHFYDAIFHWDKKLICSISHLIFHLCGKYWQAVDPNLAIYVPVSYMLVLVAT